MTALLLWAMLVPCTVHGYLFDRDGDVSLVRDDGCQATVRQHVGSHQLLITHDDAWVLVTVPERHRRGHVVFWYKWRSPVAHFGADEVPVQAGYSAAG